MTKDKDWCDEIMNRIEKIETDLKDRDTRLTIIETLFNEVEKRIGEIKEQIKTFSFGMILTTTLGFVGIIITIALK